MDRIKSAWDLFNSAFKLGDEVLLIDDEDKVYWGKLSSFNDDFCVLRRPNGRDTEFKWEYLMFMSHDGFPCKKLLGADGSKSIERIDTTSIQKALRTALLTDLCFDCDKRLVPHNHLRREQGRSRCAPCKKVRRQYLIDHPPRRTYYRGDPFRIENVASELFNVGLSGEPFWNEHYEETLVLKSIDGAIAHVFALDTIYHVETT